jgi:hypothetical protein
MQKREELRQDEKLGATGGFNSGIEGPDLVSDMQHTLAEDMELPLAPSEGHSTPWLPSLSGPSDRPLADQARLVLGGPSPILGGTEQRDELIEKVQAFMQATCGHGVKRCKGNERRVPIRCLCADCSFEVILRSGKKCNNVWTVDFNRSCWEHKLKTGSGPCSSLPSRDDESR